jgi:uncharacterized protein with HEPN domain
VKDDKLYLIHISECIADINEYTAGSRETMVNSKLVQDAVIRKLQVMAESTLRLAEATKATHPEVNWRAIRGFRNVVVHDYMQVDLKAVGDIIEQDLPILKLAVEAMLKSVEEDKQE